MNKNYAILIPLLCFGLPLLFCSVFKIFQLGSVGPMVPATGILCALIFPYVLYSTFSIFFKRHGIELILIILAIPLGIFLAIIEMNIFIGISATFGMMDYQLM